MNAGPPPPVGRNGGDERKARRALWVAGAGVVIGLATAVVAVVGDMSVKLAILLGVPATVLTFGGLAVAVVSDPETAERQGFRVGLMAGSLRRWWRLFFGRRGKGGP
jgi:hypothetical protein